jgi:hypothetical protein
MTRKMIAARPVCSAIALAQIGPLENGVYRQPLQKPVCSARVIIPVPVVLLKQRLIPPQWGKRDGPVVSGAKDLNPVRRPG